MAQKSLRRVSEQKLGMAFMSLNKYLTGLIYFPALWYKEDSSLWYEEDSSQIEDSKRVIMAILEKCDERGTFTPMRELRNLISSFKRKYKIERTDFLRVLCDESEPFRVNCFYNFLDEEKNELKRDSQNARYFSFEEFEKMNRPWTLIERVNSSYRSG